MKILSVVGARPQFVKAAVFRQFCCENDIQEQLLHTGQHYDEIMSTQIFKELGVKLPDINLKISNRSQGGMTGELLKPIEDIILQLKPDFVNVYGDTNSTLAAALAASKIHVPVIHIEAGLRSFNKKMPEEINRIITDHVSSILFCPTNASVLNLKKENIVDGVHHVGDIMYDAIEKFKSKFIIPRYVSLEKNKKIAVLTIHRLENVSNHEKLKEIINYSLEHLDEYEIFFPLHPNTRKKIKEYGILTKGIKLIKPLSYLEMQGILSVSNLILTDSGGVQKEAYFHGVNCVTLRNETEWIELVDNGWNRLWNSKGPIINKRKIDEYGDGKSVEKMFSIIPKYI